MLSRGSRCAYKSNCPKPRRKEEISGASPLFFPPTDGKWQRGTRSSFFRKLGDFWSANSLAAGVSRLWLKVSLGLREQYLCQGSRACTFCSRAGEQKIETLSLSLSLSLPIFLYLSIARSVFDNYPVICRSKPI